MNTIPACGHPLSPHDSFITGYGVDKENRKHCYECCAKNDIEQMITDGKFTLYLVEKLQHKYEVTNWPGSLRFNVHHLKIGKHNLARKRYDVWFTGPDGKNWHGTQYGDNTQLVHCRRLKK